MRKWLLIPVHMLSHAHTAAGSFGRALIGLAGPTRIPYNGACTALQHTLGSGFLRDSSSALVVLTCWYVRASSGVFWVPAVASDINTTGPVTVG
jgi:hypothetical protein